MRTTLTALALLAAIAAPAPAQNGPTNETLARYARALDLNPENTFYQYAVAQTARRLDVEPPATRFRPTPPGRWSTQLYEMTTGAAAVQESLQIDRIAGAGDVVGAATIPIGSIEGVTTPSVPFDKLIGGRQPVVEPLAKVAPADWYYVHFTKASGIRRVLAAADRWGTHLLSAYEITGRDARVREKVEAQTLLRAAPELESFYDLVVGDAILVGSDPFLEEGSDVTAVFTVKNALVFTTRLELDRRTAVAAASGASVIHEPYRAWMVDGVVSADHSLSSFAAMKNGLAIVSNSFEALRHVADVADGLAPSLAAADDFKYMRAIKPYAETDEDAFLFLSDAFVRRTTGPELKIGEARRVRCAVSLQTLAYAELMFRTEIGRAPSSTDELVEGRYVDPKAFACPDGGSYTLDRGVPVCSVHGRLRFMKPNLEIAIEKVAPEEAQAYAIFREGYKTYWRRYVDPVGVRVRAGATLDVDATILPLVENSAYASAVEAMGSEPVSLARPQAPDAVATLDVKLPTPAKDGELARDVGRLVGVDGVSLLAALGDHASVQIADGAPSLQTDFAGMFGGPTGGALNDWLIFSPLVASLTLPTAVVVPVRDRAALDKVLADFRAKVAAEWGRDAWFDVEGYQLVEGGARTVEAVSVRLFVLRWRVYYAVAGDRLILATDRARIDALASAEPTGTEPGAIRLELAPSRWKRLGPSLALAYEEDARRVCLANVAWLEALRAATGKAPRELDADALTRFGATFDCPDGGTYVVDAGGAVQCSLHGTRGAPRQGPRPQPGSPAAFMLEGVRRVEATLTFTPDGLTTRLRIE
jgi:hypothetical protein